MSSLNAYRMQRSAIAILELYGNPRPLSDTKLRKAVSHKRTSRFIDQLQALSTDSRAEPASSSALECAREVLRQLEMGSLHPIKISNAAEGGVAICFANREKYADIECLNSGEILGVISNRRDHPIVWEVEPRSGGIAGAIARIREFLASPPQEDASSRAAV
jgi:hypothetical protein